MQNYVCSRGSNIGLKDAALFASLASCAQRRLTDFKPDDLLAPGAPGQGPVRHPGPKKGIIGHSYFPVNFRTLSRKFRGHFPTCSWNFPRHSPFFPGNFPKDLVNILQS